MTQNFELFFNNLYLDNWQNITLKKKVGLIILITWFPLILLAAIEGLALGETRAQSIILDSAIQLRFLLALPLFLITPNFTGKRLKHVVSQFLKGDIIRKEDQSRFNALVESTNSFRDSRIVQLLIWILIYTISFIYSFEILPHLSPSWKVIAGENGNSLSLAGRWFVLVSQPIYLFFGLHFLYRGTLWWRFIFKISRFPLQIRPSHGDNAGGLSFLGESIKSFMPPVIALSTSLAAGISNLVLFENLSLEALQSTFFTLLLFLLIFFIGPQSYPSKFQNFSISLCTDLKVSF